MFGAMFEAMGKAGLVILTACALAVILACVVGIMAGIIWLFEVGRWELEHRLAMNARSIADRRGMRPLRTMFVGGIVVTILMTSGMLGLWMDSTLAGVLGVLAGVIFAIATSDPLLAPLKETHKEREARMERDGVLNLDM